jgi:hypothetical protein
MGISYLPYVDALQFQMNFHGGLHHVLQKDELLNPEMQLRLDYHSLIYQKGKGSMSSNKHIMFVETSRACTKTLNLIL